MHPRPPVPNQSCRHRSTLQAGPDAVPPKPQGRATPGAAASRSFRCRTPSPWASPPNECPSSGQRGSRARHSDWPLEAAPPSASAWVAVEGVGCVPKAQRARYLGPSKYTMHLFVEVQGVLLPLLNETICGQCRHCCPCFPCWVLPDPDSIPDRFWPSRCNPRAPALTLSQAPFSPMPGRTRFFGSSRI